MERVEDYLREQGVVDDAFVEACYDDADEELEDAIETAESHEPASPDQLFDPVYEDLPPNLVEQKQWLQEYVDAHPDVNEIDH